MPYAPFQQNKKTAKYVIFVSILEFFWYFMTSSFKSLHAKSLVMSHINQISF